MESKTLEIAGRLKLAREQAGLTQGQVAQMLGLHRPAISEIEAGRRRVSAEELAKLATIYDVDMGWLTSDRPEDEPDVDWDKVELAARELSKLKPADLDRLLKTLRRSRKTTDGK